MSDKEHDELLWQRVEEYRQKLKDCDDYPVLAALKESWETLQSDQSPGMRKIHNGRMAENPIVAVMFCIDTGEYPSPELLLTLLSCYNDYMRGNGDLEALFFGRPKQKLGNHARQEAKDSMDILIRSRFAGYLDDGFSRIDSAEKVVIELGLDVDADSILRKLRGFNGFRKGVKPKHDRDEKNA